MNVQPSSHRHEFNIVAHGLVSLVSDILRVAFQDGRGTRDKISSR